MTPELESFINENWHLCPQMPYVIARIFAGAILMDSEQILVNTVDMYGRLQSLDVHH